MKTKVCLGLSVCCLLVCVGVLMQRTVQAHGGVHPDAYPVSVVLLEDVMRGHGKQVKSYCESVHPGSYKEYLNVPADSRFIVTDVMVATQNTLRVTFDEPTAGKDKCHVQLYANPENLGSGIVYEPNEIVRVSHGGSAVSQIAISGYFVDL